MSKIYVVLGEKVQWSTGKATSPKEVVYVGNRKEDAKHYTRQENQNLYLEVWENGKFVAGYFQPRGNFQGAWESACGEEDEEITNFVAMD